MSQIARWIRRGVDLCLKIWNSSGWFRLAFIMVMMVSMLPKNPIIKTRKQFKMNKFLIIYPFAEELGAISLGRQSNLIPTIEIRNLTTYFCMSYHCNLLCIPRPSKTDLYFVSILSNWISSSENCQLKLQLSFLSHTALHKTPQPVSTFIMRSKNRIYPGITLLKINLKVKLGGHYLVEWGPQMHAAPSKWNPASKRPVGWRF